MGDFRHVDSELSRISRESEDIRRQGVPLNNSSGIKRQSVRGSRGGNRDEGVIMDMSTDFCGLVNADILYVPFYWLWNGFTVDSGASALARQRSSIAKEIW